jgi:hypothetical protein
MLFDSPESACVPFLDLAHALGIPAEVMHAIVKVMMKIVFFSSTMRFLLSTFFISEYATNRDAYHINVRVNSFARRHTYVAVMLFGYGSRL